MLESSNEMDPIQSLARITAALINKVVASYLSLVSQVCFLQKKNIKHMCGYFHPGVMTGVSMGAWDFTGV